MRFFNNTAPYGKSLCQSRVKMGTVYKQNYRSVEALTLDELSYLFPVVGADKDSRHKGVSQTGYTLSKAISLRQQERGINDLIQY